MQQANPSTTFQLLLSTTEQTIQELGCKKTTLQEIINRTGLSKGAIYHYVKSKDELLGLVLQHRMEQTNARFDEAVAASSSQDITLPLQALTEQFGHMLLNEQEVGNQIFFYLLSQQDNPEVKKMLAQHYENSIQFSVRWIQIGQQNNVIPPELDPYRTSKMFWVYLHGLRIQRLLAPHAEKLDLHSLFSMFYHTLKMEQA